MYCDFYGWINSRRIISWIILESIIVIISVNGDRGGDHVENDDLRHDGSLHHDVHDVPVLRWLEFHAEVQTDDDGQDVLEPLELLKGHGGIDYDDQLVRTECMDKLFFLVDKSTWLPNKWQNI